MKIVKDSDGNKYVDEELRNYINAIWVNYDIEIENDKNIFFAKNTTVNRLISDYCGKNISRVIKREKADYVIINRFDISGYPQYFDGTNLTDDETQEVVYGIYNCKAEVQDTIELILDFLGRGQEVKFVNQDKLNDSLNNGFIIDKENYVSLKELIDSPNGDNHELAMKMLIGSSLKDNWQWILYLYHGNKSQLNYDEKSVISKYFSTLGLGLSVHNLLSSIDFSLAAITNEDVKERFISMVREKFNRNIKQYLEDYVETEKFVLDDFKIRYNA